MRLSIRYIFIINLYEHTDVILFSYIYSEIND